MTSYYLQYILIKILGGNNDPNKWYTTTPSTVTATPSTVTTTPGYSSTTEMYELDPDLDASGTNAWVTPLMNGLSSAGKIAYC